MATWVAGRSNKAKRTRLFIRDSSPHFSAPEKSHRNLWCRSGPIFAMRCCYAITFAKSLRNDFCLACFAQTVCKKHASGMLLGFFGNGCRVLRSEFVASRFSISGHRWSRACGRCDLQDQWFPGHHDAWTVNSNYSVARSTWWARRRYIHLSRWVRLKTYILEDLEGILKLFKLFLFGC